MQNWNQAILLAVNLLVWYLYWKTPILFHIMLIRLHSGCKVLGISINRHPVKCHISVLYHSPALLNSCKNKEVCFLLVVCILIQSVSSGYYLFFNTTYTWNSGNGVAVCSLQVCTDKRTHWLFAVLYQHRNMLTVISGPFAAGTVAWLSDCIFLKYSMKHCFSAFSSQQ